MPSTVIRAGSYRPRSTSIASLGGDKVNWNRRGLNQPVSRQGEALADRAMRGAMSRGMRGVGLIEFGDRLTQGIVYGSSPGVHGLGGKSFCEGAGAPVTSAVLQIAGAGMTLYGSQSSSATKNAATGEVMGATKSNPTMQSGGGIMSTAGDSIMAQCNARNAAATGDPDALAAIQAQAAADLGSATGAGMQSGPGASAEAEQWIGGVKNEYLIAGVAAVALVFFATQK